VFTSFRDPDLADRARRLAGLPAAAFLATQLYFSLYPLLESVPRWLFETIRLLLLAGAAGGLAGVGRLALLGLRARRGGGELDNLDRFNRRALLWLALVLAAALACLHLLLGMSIPGL